MCSVFLLIHIPSTSWEDFGDQSKAEMLSMRIKRAKLGSEMLYIGIPRAAGDLFRNGPHTEIPMKSRGSASL